MKTIKLTLPAAAIAAALLAPGPVLAESVEIDALAILAADGEVLRSGPERSVFAGSMSGPYLVDAGAGPVPAGEIACVGTIAAETTSGKQRAQAECRLMADDGAVGFARFACEGVRLVGCTGPFEFTGGEGRLEGLSGGGRIVLRRSETELSPGDGTVREKAFGIASWKNLSVTLPDPK